MCGVSMRAGFERPALRFVGRVRSPLQGCFVRESVSQGRDGWSADGLVVVFCVRLLSSENPGM